MEELDMKSCSLLLERLQRVDDDISSDDIKVILNKCLKVVKKSQGIFCKEETKFLSGLYKGYPETFLTIRDYLNILELTEDISLRKKISLILKDNMKYLEHRAAQENFSL